MSSTHKVWRVGITGVMYNAPFDRDYFIESKLKNAPRTIEKRAIVLAIEDGIEAPRVKYLEWSNSPHVG